MEYVFGAEGEVEILKVKAGSHTDLTGFHQIVQTYPDQTVTDRFRIVKKIDTAEDDEGNCYDWYEIDRYYRTTDKSGPVAQATAQNAANIDYISMMAGIDLPGGEEGQTNE